MNNTPLTAALLIDLLSNVDGDTIVGIKSDDMSIAINGISFTSVDGESEFVVVQNNDDLGFVFEL